MDSYELVDGLHFDDQFLFDQKVDAIAAIEAIALVDYGQWYLLCVYDASLGEFEAQACLVCGFQQAWSELAMNFDRRSDYAFG